MSDDNNVACPNCDEPMEVGGTCDSCGYDDSEGHNVECSDSTEEGDD